VTTEVTEVTEKKRVGRPNVIAAEKIISNGFAQHQWDWLQKEAKAKGIDAAQYQRMILDWWIDSVEAARSASVATPLDDRKFEKLIKPKKPKASTSNKNTKNKQRSNKK